MEEHERIELRSEDVQEIIGTPPRWIVRWGTFVVSAAVVAMIAMSFFVEYPDKVVGSVTVTSKVAAVRVNAQQSGRVSNMFVEDGDTVVKNQLLIVMQDAANWEDVEELEELVKRLKEYDNQELIDFFPSEFINTWEVGRLQPYYSQLQTDFKDFQFVEKNNAVQKEIFRIRRQITQMNDGVDIEDSKIKDAEKDMKLAYRAYQRARTSYDNDQSVSLQELENREREWRNARLKVRNIQDRRNEKLLQISGMQKQIGDLEDRAQETNNKKIIQLEKSINNLLAEIDKWNEEHLIFAAMDGKITMINNWSENQNFQQSQEILAILPKDMQENLFIQLLIPIDGSGKIKVGQKVLLKFDNYPYREYGQVDGEVVDLPGLPMADPNVPTNTILPVKIKLTNGLVTRSGKELKFEQVMRGVGEIITEDRSVFIRIFESIADPFLDK
ncbi:MAG: HlyD family efflux transporter periplasmic adaptor subunit [Bacteroidota bacterium]